MQRVNLTLNLHKQKAKKKKIVLRGKKYHFMKVKWVVNVFRLVFYGSGLLHSTGHWQLTAYILHWSNLK